MSSVLLTGANGFIGSQAIDPLLRAGHEVHAVSRSPGTHTEACWHSLDLRDGHAVADLLARVRPERLLHLAWYSEPGAFWAAAENLDWVGATLSLLRRFGEHGGSRAVLAGTCAEYEWGPASASCSELHTPLSPATLYGTAKHATNQVASAYAREHDMELAWGRIFFLYGPGEHPRRLLPAVARNLLAGRPAPTTSGTQIRDLMHVRDVAGAFVALLDSSVDGSVNIASGEGVELRHLIDLVARASGRPELLRLGALPQRPGEPEAIVANVERLKLEVGFEPSVPLERGVAETVSWWRSRRDRLEDARPRP
jgi:nucleoside-diphosphate-sugar epimerase